MHWKLKKILEKYDYQLPKILEQKLTKYILDVGEVAKIKEPVELAEIRGGM